MLEKQKRRFITVLGVLAIIYIILISIALILFSKPVQPEPSPAFRTMIDQVEFNRRLVKHGLAILVHGKVKPAMVSFIENWPTAPYFIRDGQKCRF